MEEGGFEWDSYNIEHIKEHNISPAEAEQALVNEPLYPPENPKPALAKCDGLFTGRQISFAVWWLFSRSAGRWCGLLPHTRWTRAKEKIICCGELN
jgi:hypothetical protein